MAHPKLINWEMPFVQYNVPYNMNIVSRTRTEVCVSYGDLLDYMQLAAKAKVTLSN